MKGQPKQEGIGAAEAFAQAHDPDLDHAVKVRETSLALFDAMGEMHGLGDEARVLLNAAAMMHDTGYENRPDKHHKGSRDLIMGSNLAGFSMRELMMVACIARYHRKADPDAQHKVYCDLAADDQEVVAKLAAILRVADGLDRSHQGSVESVSVDASERGLVRIQVCQHLDNTVDIAAGLRKGGLFERVFDVSLDITRENEEEAIG